MEILTVAKFTRPATISGEQIELAIGQLRDFPALLQETLARLSDDQLGVKTLPGVWTIAQVVHHVADSHMNAFVRFKLALTEDRPVIKPYNQPEFAKLPDATTHTSARVSAALLTALHNRWFQLISATDRAALQREYFHPEENRGVPLTEATLMYAWHGRYHLAHIHALMQDRGWV